MGAWGFLSRPTVALLSPGHKIHDSLLKRGHLLPTDIPEEPVFFGEKWLVVCHGMVSGLRDDNAALIVARQGVMPKKPHIYAYFEACLTSRTAFSCLASSQHHRQ